MIVKGIFGNDTVLCQILNDQSVGLPFVQKFVATSCSSNEEKISLTKALLKSLASIRSKYESHRRFKEELEASLLALSIPSKDEQLKGLLSTPTPGFYKHLASPAKAIPATSQAAEEMLPPKYPQGFVLPTPNQSPTHTKRN